MAPIVDVDFDTNVADWGSINEPATAVGKSTPFNSRAFAATSSISSSSSMPLFYSQSWQLFAMVSDRLRQRGLPSETDRRDHCEAHPGFTLGTEAAELRRSPRRLLLAGTAYD